MTPRCGPSTVRASCCSSSTTHSHLVWNGSKDRPSDESGNCDLRKSSRPARGRNPPGRSPLWSTAPSTTQLCARTVLARLGQRAVYSWKVQVPQTSLLLRWTLVSSTASTRKPCQSRPGAVSRSRVSVASTSSVSHAPVSAKVSSAFQSSGRFRASTDWVMVCSSTFNAKPVTHSTKRFHPGVVKHVAKGRSNSCHSDQNKRACIGHLSSARIRSGQGPSDMIRLRGVRVDPGDHLMYVRLLKIPGNYCLLPLLQGSLLRAQGHSAVPHPLAPGDRRLDPAPRRREQRRPQDRAARGRASGHGHPLQPSGRFPCQGPPRRVGRSFPPDP